MTEVKRTYKVVVKDSALQIEDFRSFDNLDNALICFHEFSKGYNYYKSITLESIHK